MKRSSIIACIFIVTLSASSCVPNKKNAQSVPTNPDEHLSYLLAEHKVTPIIKPKTDPDKVELGRILFWDKLLSGNKNISCATCHLPEAATSDNLPVSVGQGGKGKMTKRIPPKNEKNLPVFIPRNSLDIFNRGDMVTFFWDGRLMVKKDGKFIAPVGGTPERRKLKYLSPAGHLLPQDLDSGLAAQAMFPVTSVNEMRGNPHENNVAALKNWEWQEMWDGLIARIVDIEEYRTLFKKIYPDIPAEKLTFGHAANAIAAFEIEAFTLTDAPFDQYLQGNKEALSDDAKKGAILFYGKAGCGKCHSGPLMTDEVFHNRAVPQLGPGKGANIPAGRSDGTWDAGRGGATGITQYFYSFRTPPLRNVAKTGPWMHDGLYSTLESAVRHQLDPIGSAKSYDPYAHLTRDVAELYRAEQMDDILSFVDPEETKKVNLSEGEIKQLLTFMESLTSPSLDTLVKWVPEKVPSGLAVED